MTEFPFSEDEYNKFRDETNKLLRENKQYLQNPNSFAIILEKIYLKEFIRNLIGWMKEKKDMGLSSNTDCAVMGVFKIATELKGNLNAFNILLFLKRERGYKSDDFKEFFKIPILYRNEQGKLRVAERLEIIDSIKQLRE